MLFSYGSHMKMEIKGGWYVTVPFYKVEWDYTT